MSHCLGCLLALDISGYAGGWRSLHTPLVHSVFANWSENKDLVIQWWLCTYSLVLNQTCPFLEMLVMFFTWYRFLQSLLRSNLTSRDSSSIISRISYSQTQQSPFLPRPTNIFRQRLQYAGLLKCFSLHRWFPSSFTLESRPRRTSRGIVVRPPLFHSSSETVPSAS